VLFTLEIRDSLDFTVLSSLLVSSATAYPIDDKINPVFSQILNFLRIVE
jgi:hypothetical protein